MRQVNGVECNAPSGCPLRTEQPDGTLAQLCRPTEAKWEELRKTDSGRVQASYIGPCMQNRTQHDSLTGLDTYDTMLSKIGSRFRHPSRRTEVIEAPEGAYSSVTLGFADGNNFGDINNDYDHFVGDLVICSMADLLRYCTRDGDLRVRRSGDEFAFALFGLSREEAVTATGRLQQEFAAGGEVNLAPEQVLRWTAAVVSVYLHNPTSTEEVEAGFQYADSQLGEWKKTDRMEMPPPLMDFPAAA